MENREKIAVVEASRHNSMRGAREITARAGLEDLLLEPLVLSTATTVHITVSRYIFLDILGSETSPDGHHCQSSCRERAILLLI